MADKIDSLKIGSTSYDIDLPPDATPSIASLGLKKSGTSNDVKLTGTTNGLKVENLYNSGEEYVVFDTSSTQGAFKIEFDDSQSSQIYTFPSGSCTLAKSDHTHAASIAQSGSSGTSLAHNTWYTLTVAGSTVTFKTPSDNNTNYYATSDFTSSNGTKIATGYSGSSATSTYDLYAPNATSSQAGLVTTSPQTFMGQKTFMDNNDSAPIVVDHDATLSNFFQVNDQDSGHQVMFYLKTNATADRSINIPVAQSGEMLVAPDPTSNKGKFLYSNASTGAVEWVAGGTPTIIDLRS